jgi:hypothetical protein
MINRVCSTGNVTSEQKLRNIQTGETITRSYNIKTVCTSHPEMRLHAAYVGDIKVVGKADPLIFAADVVTNSLWRHLSRLSADADLNDVTSVEGWPLRDITFTEPRPGASSFDQW